MTELLQITHSFIVKLDSCKNINNKMIKLKH